MGKKRKSRKWTKSAENVEIKHTDVAVESANPESDMYVDEVDRFHREREEAMLSRSKLDVEGRENEETDEEEEEGVLDIDSDEKTDDEMNQFYHEEESEEEVEDDLRAWGSKKKTFYNTNYVDDELGSGSEDETAALEEEKEALAIQKRMAEGLDDEDFDTEEFQLPLAGKAVLSEDEDVATTVAEETVIKDLSQLSRDEKLEILMRESPELFELLEDFHAKMVELKERVYPLVLKLRERELIDSEGRDFMEMKLKLLLNYCVNILFYLVLRSRQTPNLQHHPIISHLVQLRTLLGKSKPIDEKISEEMDQIFAEKREMITKKKKCSIPEEGPIKQTDTKKDSALEYYYKAAAKKAELKANRKRSIDKATQKTSKKVKFRDDSAAKEDVNRRGINYQISKNKGLTPHRKKEQRNPRVKHRRKYSKALIRRKGQVRPVTSAQLYYGGEQTGIRSHVTKSVKIH
ncbi:something about silencing protein 10-like isoform X2 [Oscarella lobularis]|uniref:something about silencing protein 10-like isoform X2 n=1 Tax=Oscarella lobularis TaxID=121494 RepID=UPI003313E729